MENVKDNQTLDNTNAFFSDYFTDIDLNKDIQMLYEIIGTDDSQDEFAISSDNSMVPNYQDEEENIENYE